MRQKNQNSQKESNFPFGLASRITSLIEVQQTNRSAIDIILWWEKKRIPFNIVLLIVGFVCTEITRLFYNLNHEVTIFSQEQILTFFLLSNLGFTLSCFSELFVKQNKKYAPKLFINGLYFLSLLILFQTITQLM